jgi:hypothetical protein
MKNASPLIPSHKHVLRPNKSSIHDPYNNTLHTTLCKKVPVIFLWMVSLSSLKKLMYLHKLDLFIFYKVLYNTYLILSHVLASSNLVPKLSSRNRRKRTKSVSGDVYLLGKGCPPPSYSERQQLLLQMHAACCCTMI